MTARSYDDLYRALKKGELAPLYYLYGTEDVLKEEAVQAILDRALDPSLRDFNLDQRSAGQLDSESLHSLVNTLPMLAERRVAVVRDVENFRKKSKARATLTAYLENPAPETVLILVQGSGEEDADAEFAKAACAVKLDRLEPARAERWAARRAEQLGVRFAAGALEHLVHVMECDLGQLGAELEKLSSLVNQEPLTLERIGDLVGIRHGETPHDWRDAMLNDDPGLALKLLRPLLDQPGMSGVKLVALLGTTLVGVRVARSHYDRKTRGRDLEEAVFKTLLRIRVFGLGDWKVEARRWSEWAGQWPRHRIQRALRACLDADRALKSTTISGELGVLTDLALKLAVPVKGMVA